MTWPITLIKTETSLFIMTAFKSKNDYHEFQIVSIDAIEKSDWPFYLNPINTSNSRHGGSELLVSAHGATKLNYELLPNRYNVSIAVYDKGNLSDVSVVYVVVEDVNEPPLPQANITFWSKESVNDGAYVLLQRRPASALSACRCQL